MTMMTGLVFFMFPLIKVKSSLFLMRTHVFHMLFFDVHSAKQK